MKFFILTILLASHLFSSSSVLYKKQENFMGSVFVIAFVDSSYQAADDKYKLIRNRIIEIEGVISSWDENSETALVNKNAGIKPIPVSPDLFYLIKRSKKISVLTNGYFDISYAAFDNIWKFNNGMSSLPDTNLVNATLKLVDYKNIVLDDNLQTVFLKTKGMKIGFGAIGKGYAANECKKLLLSLGINNGLVDAGGDLIAWGKNEKNENWQIALTDPRDKRRNIAEFDITDKAVVTSGNYEKFIDVNGVKYSHIINPKTGWPALGVKSVTVFYVDAEIADALATSIFIMGVSKGLEFADRVKDLDILIIDNENRMHASENLKLDN